MGIFGHSAEEVAPCLGMLRDGTPVRHPRDVEAVMRYLVSIRGFSNTTTRMWERDDAQHRPMIKENIEKAAIEQKRRRVIAREESYVTN